MSGNYYCLCAMICYHYQEPKIVCRSSINTGLKSQKLDTGKSDPASLSLGSFSEGLTLELIAQSGLKNYFHSKHQCTSFKSKYIMKASNCILLKPDCGNNKWHKEI